MQGGLVISQDFEMLWGSIGSNKFETFKKNVIHEDFIIDKTLELFKKYKIHATWAIVGAMLCKNSNEANNYINNDIIYKNWNFSMKDYINSIPDELNKYYFAPHYLYKLLSIKHQEIATHTFSHFYCLEDDSKKSLFEEEIQNSKKIFSEYGVEIKSIILPRNQVNTSWNDVLLKNKITAVRMRQPAFILSKNKQRSKIIDFLDSYIPIRKNLCYNIKNIKEENGVYNIKASMFYRTYNEKLKIFEYLKTARIKHEMTISAKKGLIFHLWWHPHNMGSNIKYNFKQLESILKHYKKLSSKYDYKSYNMEEIVNLLEG